MDSQNTPLGDGMDWNDPMFNTADQFTDHMNSDSTFNSAFDTNYGYLNAKPSAATAIDLLGPWPWYLLSELAVVAVLWALITLPWASPADRGHRSMQSTA